jgi:hypothetical protein
MDTSKMVFVFGSNEAGRHGAGAAKYALEERGAMLGIGYGHTYEKRWIGDVDKAHSFAIPTKDRFIRHTLHLSTIQAYVHGFLAYAAGRPDLDFQVTCIGCGLAGLEHRDIAPMFAPGDDFPNVYFDELWKPWLGPNAKFWGTF